MGYPETCDLCVRKKTNAHLFEGDIELSVRPFKGNNPKVMLVGLNPTLRDRRVSYVFDLENEHSSLYRYIVDDILKPTGLDLEDIYAINLVKCTFPDEPRRICEEANLGKKNEAVKEFISPFFQHCRQYFEAEVREIKPKILVAFGEIPHQMLVEEFGWNKQKVEKGMKNAFGNVYPVNLFGDDILYAPCIRKRAEGHVELRNRFPTFVENLKKYVISADTV